jgi:signal peptide peptidase SppA
VRDYARIVTKVRETAWLMMPEALDAMLHMLDERMKNGSISEDELFAKLNNTERGMLFHDGVHDPSGGSIVGGIGVLPLMGPIFGRANMMTQLSGATSLEQFADNFKQMLADDSISSIILDVDSPGGSSDMIHETGELIASADKPVYAVADGMAGSAAYWLASQADQLFATPSGSVGSIGVYSVHEDQSAKDALEGKRFTFISAGEHKTEGNPHEPLSEEAREFRQAHVDSLYDDFLSVVASGRGKSVKQVKENFGGGRMFRPAQALELGMIDGVRSFDQVVTEVANKPQKISVVVDGQKVAASVLNGMITMDAITTATADFNGDGAVTRTMLESKEWEHSEPGTGNPPEPRKDEDGSDDIAIVQGWRRTTPPDQSQPSGTSANSGWITKPIFAGGIISNGEGRVKMDEFVLAGKDARALLNALNLDSDTAPEKVVEAMRVQLGELAALRQSVDAVEQERIFAETYPQYWEEHRKLMERDRQHTASNFVESVLKVRKTEGYGLKDTKQQLSVEAQNVVAEAHKSFSEGKGGLEDFEKAVKAIVNGGIVQLGEIGNSKGDDLPEWDTNSAGGLANARQLFAQAVNKAQADNPGMSYTDAMKEAGRKHPDLAEAYKQTLPA